MQSSLARRWLPRYWHEQTACLDSATSPWLTLVERGLRREVYVWEAQDLVWDRETFLHAMDFLRLFGASRANQTGSAALVKVTERWRARASQLRQDTYAVYLAYRDPRTPWYARVLGAMVVAYALSLLDPIPVLGYLDDLFLIPLVYGRGEDYVPATQVFRLLVWAIPAMFLYLLSGHALYALGRQRQVTWVMLSIGVANIALNLVVIPRWSYTGAAVVALASEWLLWGLLYPRSRRAVAARGG
jgi:uncharacterized membrane protein YkvA (DUF1232 family)